METKVLFLKSGEKIICGLEENENNTNKYHIQYPRVISSIKVDQKTKTLNINYEPWCAYIIEDELQIDSDWVASVVEPHEDVKYNYEEYISDVIMNITRIS